MIEPKNEIETIIWFAEHREQIGFEILSCSASGFPDALVRDLATNRVLKAEFEYLSHSFVVHEHNVYDCELIICWINNFKIETDFPIWELSRGVDDIPNLEINEYDQKIVNDYLLAYHQRREEKRQASKAEEVSDWRKLRLTMNPDQMETLANLPPDKMEVWAKASGRTYRTIQNWKDNARKELGIN
jgi:hypothetical protein